VDILRVQRETLKPRRRRYPRDEGAGRLWLTVAVVATAPRVLSVNTCPEISPCGLRPSACIGAVGLNGGDVRLGLAAECVRLTCAAVNVDGTEPITGHPGAGAPVLHHPRADDVLALPGHARGQPCGDGPVGAAARRLGTIVDHD
jgi:hypothetical protein